MPHASRSPLSVSIVRPALLLLLCMPALAAPAPTAPPLLPTDFAGWSQSAPAENSAVPEAADAANAAVLKEYGFQQFATAHYANGDNAPSVFKMRVAPTARSRFIAVPAASRNKSVAVRPGMAAMSCFGTELRLWKAPSIK
jgi:hypothetical protein